MDKMSEQSIYTKIKNALKLAKAAEVGCTFDRFEAIELLGYIQALEETVGLQRAEFDAQAARVAELEALVEKGNYAIGENCNLRIELLEKTEELAALKEAQRWIPVGERLPEESGLYQVYSPDVQKEMGNVWDCSYYNRFGRGLEFATGYHVTHWMPLPQPPEAE